jgi:hypothetical protein
MYAYIFPAVDGNAFQQSCWLRAGSYLLTVLGAMDTAYGKFDWYIDGELVVSGQDWYAAGLNWAVVKTATVPVRRDGLHTIKGVINGKHVSSSGYSMIITKISLRRTGP